MKDTWSTPAPRSRAREGAGAAAPPGPSGGEGVRSTGPLRAELPERGRICPVRPGPPGYGHTCPIGPQPPGQGCAPCMHPRKGPALPTPLQATSSSPRAPPTVVLRDPVSPNPRDNPHSLSFRLSQQPLHTASAVRPDPELRPELPLATPSPWGLGVSPEYTPPLSPTPVPASPTNPARPKWSLRTCPPVAICGLHARQRCLAWLAHPPCPQPQAQAPGLTAGLS